MPEPYSLLIRSQAKKKLQGLPRSERFRITKKLEGEPYFRLRVGNWRIIFERHDVVKIIAVERIKPRGDAYK